MSKFEKWYVTHNKDFCKWYDNATEEQRGNDAMFKLSLVLIIAAVVIFLTK